MTAAGARHLRPVGWGLVVLLPVAFLATFFVVPVVGMVARGVLVDGRPDLAGLVDALVRPRVGRVLWFTVWSAGAATVVALLLGLPLAHLLYRRRFPGRDLVRAWVLVPFVLPTVVVGIAFRRLLAGPLAPLDLDGSAVGIVAALVFFNVAVVVRTVGSHWAGLDPRRAEAAAALGASPWRVARTVTLPALTPALLSAASVVFLFCATSFGVVLTMGGLRYANVETEIWLLTTQFLDLRGAAALSILQVAVVVGLLLLARATQGRTEQTLDRSTRRTPRPGRRDLPAVAVSAVVLAFLAAPVVSLVAGSLRTRDGWGLDHYARLAGGDGLSATVSQALTTSLRIAVDATVLAVGLGIVIAVLLAARPRGRRRRAVRVLDGLVMLPLGVSAVTVGFGLLVTFDRPPLDLRSSILLVPVAQAMVALPLVVRTLLPVLRAIDPRMREAAAALGASPLRVMLSVDLPLAWRGLAAAAGFAFAVSLGEFGATSFLARPDTPTLPVLIYQLIGRPGIDNAGAALAGSVVLAAVTTLVMLGVERLRAGTLGEW